MSIDLPPQTVYDYIEYAKATQAQGIYSESIYSTIVSRDADTIPMSAEQIIKDYIHWCILEFWDKRPQTWALWVDEQDITVVNMEYIWTLREECQKIKDELRSAWLFHSNAKRTIDEFFYEELFFFYLHIVNSTLYHWERSLWNTDCRNDMVSIVFLQTLFDIGARAVSPEEFIEDSIALTLWSL